MRPVFIPMLVHSRLHVYQSFADQLSALSRSSLPVDANVPENSKAKRVRRARYSSTSPEVEGGWISTIDIEVDLPIFPPIVDEMSAVDENEIIAAPTGQVDALIKQTHRRSWFIMCPDR